MGGTKYGFTRTVSYAKPESQEPRQLQARATMTDAEIEETEVEQADRDVEADAISQRQYQAREYWAPELSANEWSLLNRSLYMEIGKNSKYLDEATKWLYAKEKDAEVFAIYGIGDGTEPTPLYATGGKKATADFATFNKYLRGLKNDYSGDTPYAWLEAVSSAKREYHDSYAANGHRRKALGLDSILSKHSESLRSRNNGGSAENSEGLKQHQARATMTEAEIEETDVEQADRDVEADVVNRRQYEIRNLNGELLPVIDTQNDTRDFDAAEAYLRTLINTDQPFETILWDLQPVYIGKDLPGEYRSSEYTKSMLSKLRDIKMQAATNLEETIVLAEHGEWQENLKEKHNVDAKNGWYRYDTQFAVPILNAKKAIDHYTVYSATLLIRNDADGKSYLYDLVDIEKRR